MDERGRSDERRGKTETVTAKREREDETEEESDRQLCGTVKIETERKTDEERGGHAHGRKRQKESVKAGRRQRKIKK